MNGKDFDAILLLPYYGKYPIWINAFLRSCAFNPKLKWMIFSDIEVPKYRPENVEFVHLKKIELSNLILKKTGISHALEDPHKLCDFKPLYGHIFEEFTREFQYWGHCDMDVIWGDLVAFLNKISHDQYDIISSRQQVICGHFNLYRNTTKINHFYKEVPHFEKAFQNISYQGFDEGFFSYHLFKEVNQKKVDFKVFWNGRNCIDRGELQRMPNGWSWKNGKIRNKWGKDGPYLHMIDWKRSMLKATLSAPDKVNYFQINQFGIWPKRTPWRYRKKLLMNPGWRQQILYMQGKLLTFIKHGLWRKKKPLKPNVLPEYQILK